MRESQNVIFLNPDAHNILNTIKPLELDEEKYFCIAAGFEGTTAHDGLRLEIRRWVKERILALIEAPPEWHKTWRSEEYFQSRFAAPVRSQGNFALPRL